VSLLHVPSWLHSVSINIGRGTEKINASEVLHSSALARVFGVILPLKEIIAYKKEEQHNKKHVRDVNMYPNRNSLRAVWR
jgi:hypothetical protein